MLAEALRIQKAKGFSTKVRLDGLVFGAGQVFLRIHRLIVDTNFVMQVRARRSTSRSNQPDDLSARDHLANGDINSRQVSVARGQPAAVIDVHDVAVTAL